MRRAIARKRSSSSTLWASVATAGSYVAARAWSSGSGSTLPRPLEILRRVHVVERREIRIVSKHVLVAKELRGVDEARARPMGEHRCSTLPRRDQRARDAP